MYSWEALVNNELVKQIEQIDGLSEEQRSKTTKFQWVNYETGHRVGVNLATGVFFAGNQILHAGEDDVRDLSYRGDYRIIYATRHTIIGGGDIPDNYLYLVGWQFTLNGKNYKRILYVRPDGEIIFGGN
jgi:hypothetical protein